MSPRHKRPQAVVSLRDPSWLEPLDRFQRREFYSVIEGVECSFSIEADRVRGSEVGWARVVGVGIGLGYGAHDHEEGTADRLVGAGLIRWDEPCPDVLDVLAKARIEAARVLDGMEFTRRLRLALDTDERRPQAHGRRGKGTGLSDREPRDEWRVAALIYNLCIEEGKSNPGAFIDEWLGCRPSKRKQLLARAEAEGAITQRLAGGPTRPRSGTTKGRRK